MPSDLARALERARRRLARRLGLVPERVRLRVVGDEEIRSLAATHMGEDHVTDVLSFPDGEGGGDVALCWPQILRASPAAPREEALRLLVHALAHLAGHDHHVRQAARQMLRVERRHLRRLGVPDVPRPYDERGGRP